MPELAEVAYYAKQWDAGKGQPIVRLELNARVRVFRNCDVAALEQGLVGQMLVSSRTHGKQMLFEFTGGHWLTVHLGMSGDLKALPEPFEPAKHDHLVLHTKKLALVFADPRQFGSVLYDQGCEPPAAWLRLPPQPMNLTATRLKEVLQRHARTPLKALLLDQRYFPGIGNWMADEVMWQTKLHPQTPAGSLDDKQTTAVWKTVRKVCDVALKTIGVDWSDPPKTWLFQHRWDKGRTCPRCGAALVKEDLRGRTACWCPVCQTLK